ncbi:unnamed protein product, partial [Amoebophrya sp. A25]
SHDSRLRDRLPANPEDGWSVSSTDGFAWRVGGFRSGLAFPYSFRFSVAVGAHVGFYSRSSLPCSCLRWNVCVAKTELRRRQRHSL